MRTIYLSLLAGLLVACAGGPGPTEVVPLIVMTHDSFSASETVLEAFEKQAGVSVQLIQAGDAGTALNKAILSKDNPIADVFFGVDSTFLSRALEEDIFEPYESPLLAAVPDEFELDPSHHALPVDYGDVCLNFDKVYFEERNLEPPADLDSLTRPEYAGLLVVQNPASSSPGLAFLLATVATYGDPGYLDYWRALRDNDLLVVEDWETAYYTEFSGSSGQGPRPIVVSYASSPPAEVMFADPPVTEAPTSAITADAACFRQIEFVGILRDTPRRALAEQWVDFMLSVQFQEDMPLQMFVFPVNPDATLPDVFAQHATLAQSPATLSPDEIAANREKWIEAWSEVVLR